MITISGDLQELEVGGTPSFTRYVCDSCGKDTKEGVYYLVNFGEPNVICASCITETDAVDRVVNENNQVNFVRFTERTRIMTREQIETMYHQYFRPKLTKEG